MGRYNSTKIYDDKYGKFDSKTEYEYFKKLKEREKNKEIFNLRTQEKFILQEGFSLNGSKIQAITYLADQVYEDKDGITHVVDVKGAEYTIEETFKIKFKMLKNIHRDFKYHVIIKYKGEWYDLENKDEKKLYKERKAKSKKSKKKK